MKLQKKHSSLIFALIMAFILPFVMTFFITLINAGLNEKFLLIWLKAYGIAFVVAFPAILIIAPRIRKFVESITE